MHKVLISLASNHEQEKNLSEAHKALAQVLVNPFYTPAIWTVPYGKQQSSDSPISPIRPISSISPISPIRPIRPIPQAPSSDPREAKYLNQLVSAETSLDCETLNSRLKEMEQAQGRDAEARRQGIVPLDLDLLQYEEERYHLRDWQRPYIRQLLTTLC